jgi:hypothetical protein
MEHGCTPQLSPNNLFTIYKLKIWDATKIYHSDHHRTCNRLWAHLYLAQGRQLQASHIHNLQAGINLSPKLLRCSWQDNTVSIFIHLYVWLNIVIHLRKKQMISFRERILFVWKKLDIFMKTRLPMPVKWVMSIGGQL